MISLRKYPVISTLSAGTNRPFWSVMIPTYNPNEQYLEQTLLSLLDQDPGRQEMQIEIVDDFSSHYDPKGLLKRIGQDRITYYRQVRHVGIGRNWNTCIERSRGQWLHILHQDDIVRSGFYRRLREGIEKAPDVGAAFCRHAVIDDQGTERFQSSKINEKPGILTEWIMHIFINFNVQVSSIVVRRSVYERLGGFRLDYDYVLDWDMWKRIALNYPIWFEPEVLACWRRHNASAGFKLMRSGKNIAEIRMCIESFPDCFSEKVAREISRKAKEYYTVHAVKVALRLILTQRDFRSGFLQIREARKYASSFRVFMALYRLTKKGLRDLKF